MRSALPNAATTTRIRPAGPSGPRLLLMRLAICGRSAAHRLALARPQGRAARTAECPREYAVLMVVARKSANVRRHYARPVLGRPRPGRAGHVGRWPRSGSISPKEYD